MKIDLSSIENLSFEVQGDYLNVVIRLKLNNIKDENATSHQKVEKQFPLNELPSLDDWIEELKTNDKVWSESTKDGINVPVGYLTREKVFSFCLGNDNETCCKDFNALIAGRPGYGKTVLLHNIIVNAAMKYSPDELCFYLADFAEGVDFSIYRGLPHVKAIMLVNDYEFLLRMLSDISSEVEKRSLLYKEAQQHYGKQVSNLADYRELTGKVLPRILLVISEFRMSDDITAISVKETLTKGLCQWERFGVSVILCTQMLQGMGLGGAAINMFTYRVAFNLPRLDSVFVLHNDSAQFLAQKGQAIKNNTLDGRIEDNVGFQVSPCPRLLDNVKYLEKLYEEKKGQKHLPFICDSSISADVLSNSILAENIAFNRFKVNFDNCYVYLGGHNLLRDTHTRICYHRQPNSNTLIVGTDYNTLMNTVFIQLVQLQKQSYPNSRFYIVDGSDVLNPYRDIIADGLKSSLEDFVFGNQQDIMLYLDELEAELERRKNLYNEGNVPLERIVLSIVDMQNCIAFKPVMGKFGEGASEATKKLTKLLNEGPQLGIHCIVHYGSYDRNTLREYYFENKIILRGASLERLFFGFLISAPKEYGKMTVVNAGIDGEQYEQCVAYSELTFDTLDEEGKKTVNLIKNVFERIDSVNESASTQDSHLSVNANDWIKNNFIV